MIEKYLNLEESNAHISWKKKFKLVKGERVKNNF